MVHCGTNILSLTQRWDVRRHTVYTLQDRPGMSEATVDMVQDDDES